MSFLKHIWKTSAKHEKLSDEWILAKNNQKIDPDVIENNEQIGENEVNTFELKYLGSSLVDGTHNEKATANAIKNILRVVKASGKKLNHVTVTVSSNGIKIQDDQTGKENEISIYKISYCSADAAHSKIFAFIAANNNETMECHAFLCAKRKIAHAVTLALARSFSMAYESWRDGSEKAANGKKPEIPRQIPIAVPSAAPPHHSYQLIDVEDFHDDHQPLQTMNASSPFGDSKQNWVSFDEDFEVDSRRSSQAILFA